MIRLLQWLVFGHVHKWREDRREDRTFIKEDDFGETSRKYGQVVFCTCERCGEPRRFDLK